MVFPHITLKYMNLIRLIEYFFKVMSKYQRKSAQSAGVYFTDVSLSLMSFCSVWQYCKCWWKQLKLHRETQRIHRETQRYLRSGISSYHAKIHEPNSSYRVFLCSEVKISSKISAIWGVYFADLEFFCDMQENYCDLENLCTT